MSTAPESAPRTSLLTDQPGLAQRAAALLQTPQSLLPLSAEDAACVAAHMVLVHYAPRATVLMEGDDRRSNYLLLLLEGDVSVETLADAATGPVAIGVIGAGSIIGEMALLDGAPRSANCVAVSAVQAAGLSRPGLERLIANHPQVAVKLLIGLATRISERLRALSEQLRLHAQIIAGMQAELDRLRAASGPARLEG
jgi:CRP/FNR family transcriptional regulator, cyclic AMP receptor protein